MKSSVFSTLQNLGYTGSQDSTAQSAIDWLNSAGLLRIEPYWRFLGANGGFSWTKSWDEYSDPVEVACDSWEELLEIALEQSVEQALQ